MNYEIRTSGYENKLICGIVLTGGGSNLQHIRSLAEYVTGLDTRIGHPDEHLSKGAPAQLSSPLFATAVGLLMKGIAEADKRALLNPIIEEIEEEKIAPKVEPIELEIPTPPLAVKEGPALGHSDPKKSGDWLKNITGGLTEKFTNWLEDE